MKILKFPFLTLLALTFLTSCTHNTAPEDVAKSDSGNLKQKLTPLLKSVWVLTDYIRAIEQTRSPQKSADKLHGIVALVFDNEAHGDSMKVVANWNNHEGFDFMIYFIAGQNSRSIKTNITDSESSSVYTELGYEIGGKDTMLVLYRYDKEHKMLNKRTYRKIVFADTQNPDLRGGLQYVVNQAIFAGNYILIDKHEKTETKVSLKEDGTLTGMSGIKQYIIQTDFISGPVDSSDQICFQTDNAKTQCFNFQVVQDTINIFQQNKKHVAADLFYKLVRMK